MGRHVQGAQLGVRTIDINMWLQVILQGITRIAMPRMKASCLINQLLNNVGKHHLQVTTYPIIVASKSLGVRF